MIQFITGPVGAGKTFHGVRLSMDGVKKGQILVTNVELDRDRYFWALKAIHGVEVLPEAVRYFDPEENPRWEEAIPWGEGEGVVHVLLDETHLFYNSRDWSETQKNHRRLLDFLTQSRKAGVDVTWITQEAGNVDKQFRQLAEWQIQIVNSAHLPLGPLGKLPFSCYVAKRIDPNNNIVIRKTWHAYDWWIKGTYKTASFLSGRMRDLADSVEMVKRQPVAKVAFFPRLWSKASGYFRHTIRPAKP